MSLRPPSGMLHSTQPTEVWRNLLENENYQTFINPSDVADFIANLISYDTEMFSEEIRLGRIIGEK